MSTEAFASPTVIVVMGVSGAGKTTVATLLADTLGWSFVDADDLHPPQNVRKMARGIPLTDEDRVPWLHTVARCIDEIRGSGGRGVVACSALKRSYRAILIGDRTDVRLVYLKGDRRLIARRMTARRGHFMPVSLLESQLDTLEEPGPDEHPFVVPIDARPPDIVARIVAELGLRPA